MFYSREFEGVLRKAFPIRPDKEISPTDDIFEDYGADSLSIYEFAGMLEDKFDIEIPEEDFDRLFSCYYIPWSPCAMVARIAEYLDKAGKPVYRSIDEIASGEQPFEPGSPTA